MDLRLKQAVLWAMAFSLTLIAWSAKAQEEEDEEDEDEEEVEEMVVTGSYIRRSNFDLPSPRDVVDAVDLSLAATSDLGEVVFDQTFQIGVNANSAPIEFNSADDQEFQQGSETWANLRGLGTRATMTMMDGHRVPANVTGYGSRTRRSGTDLSNLYPGIAVGRIETILDGASALYGASAVSGVINVVPRKDFDGLQVEYEYRQPLEDGAPEKRVGLLAGAQGERTKVIFALEIRDQQRMRGTDRPDYIISSANWTGQLVHPYQERPWSHPGDWNVPIRDSEGTLAPVPTGDLGWYQIGTDRGGWGNAHGWTADRYSPTRAGDWSTFPPGDPGGGWFSPVRTGAGVVPTAFRATHDDGGQGTNSDNMGEIWTARRQDPGCGYPFANGVDYTRFLTPIGLDDPRRQISPPGMPQAVYEAAYRDNPLLTTIFGDSVNNLGYSSNNQPGSYLNGFMTGELGGLSAWKGEEVDFAGNYQDCRQAIGDTFDIRERRDQETAMSYFEHTFNDYVKVRGEVVASRLEYDTRQYAPRMDDFTEDVRTVDDQHGPTVMIAVGSNPGNPYRAFADGSNGFDADSYLNYEDANGNGRYDYLDEPGEWLIFAQDANGDGIPDRGGADGTHDPLLNRNPAFRVLLLAADEDSDGDGIMDRYDPDSLGNGGVRLFEDVRLRGMNLWPKQPYNNNIPWLNPDMTWRDRSQVENYRLRLGTEISIPDSEWIVDADWIWSISRRTDDRPEGLWPLASAALRCQAGPFQNSCWNPFSTHWLATTDEGEIQPAYRDAADDTPSPWVAADGNFVGDAVNTEEEMRYAGIVLTQSRRTLGMHAVDLVASNASLLDLWYNDTPIGLAAGIHWRLESEEFLPDALGAAGIGIGGDEVIALDRSETVNMQRTEEETRAVFAEIRITPLGGGRWGEMEILAAARYAEFESRGFLSARGATADFSTTIPKLAVRYQPLDWLSIRASLTEGFVLPSTYALFQVGEARVRGTLGDYLCDQMPDLDACLSAGDGGTVSGVLLANQSNPVLGPETSDLWNTGISLQFLDGNLTFDIDYTNVEFNGRPERISHGVNLSSAGGGFDTFAQGRCPGTLLDYDNRQSFNPIPVGEYIGTTSAEELECRRQAAIAWVQSESGIAGASIVRGGIDGLQLQEVGSPWLRQGSQATETVIYAARYRFDAESVPFIGGDYGSFEWSMSATQMLTLSLCRYTDTDGEPYFNADGGRNESDSDHQYAGICVDGVGNRNNGIHYIGQISDLVEVLPATPEWRVNMNLRWFYGDHVAQLGVRWHDEVNDTLASWDPVVAAGRSVGGIWVNGRQDQGDLTGDDVCADQDRNPHCRIDSRHYWDLSYTYRRNDVFGLGFVSANLAMRNIFDTKPDAMPSGVGYDAYLDNIMGRMAFLRLSFGF